MNQPHLGVRDLAIGIFTRGEKWFIHSTCAKAPKSDRDRRNMVTLDVYHERETLTCDACFRQFGRRALERVQGHEIYIFHDLEAMQKFARKNGNQAYHAHQGYQPREEST